jgi:AraC-like DNA-binding protein
MEIADVAAGPDFAIRSVHCASDHVGWSVPEEPLDPGIVLVTRGRFQRRSRGVGIDVDTTVGYLRHPGAEESFAHPTGGDVCTWLTVSPSLWQDAATDLAGGTDVDARAAGQAAAGGVYVDAQLELAHRRLLTAAHEGTVDESLEAVISLFSVAARCTARPAFSHGVRSRATAEADAVLVRSAKDALLAGAPAARSLTSLATALMASPYRLSRAFTRETGISLTRFRNRVRVGLAMARLQDGEQNLAALAADLGFADQAHLCRTMRQHLGSSPSSIRDLLFDKPSAGVKRDS